MKKDGAVAASVSAKELRKRDFIVNGNVWKVVLLIAAPLFLYSLLSYVYSIIDTIMCSGISKEAVNAVGAISQVNNMISAIGAGLASGGSILISRQIGRKDYKKAQSYSSTIFLMVFFIGLLTCAIVIPLSEPILRAFGITEASIAVGKGYFMTSIATSAVVMINTVYMGVEKSKGSTLAITILNLGVVLLKVALNSVFLYACNLKDMTFVSLSTLIANSSLLVFILFRLASKKYLFHFSFRGADKSKKTIGKMLKISFPIFLGKFIFSLGKVVVNGLAGMFSNKDVVGALGVSNNMGGSVTNPISSIEDSTSSIISTSIGAGKPGRAINVFFVGLVYALAIAITGVTIVTIFDHQITMFFARSAGSGLDPEAQLAAQELYASEISQVFFYEKWGIITLAINSAVLGLLYGFGYTMTAGIMNIARVFLFRIPSFLICQYFIFPDDGVGGMNGFKCAGISMGFSNIAIGIVALIVGLCVVVRVKKRIKTKEESRMLKEEEKSKVNEFIDAYLKDFKPYKKGNWCYEDGVVLYGAYELYKATGDKKYLNFCVDYFDKQIAEDGSMPGYDINDHNVDDLQPGAALWKIDAIHPEPKYEKAIEIMASQFAIQPRLSCGSFYHKGRYPDQLWLDGLYMAEPFYALVATQRHSIKMTSDIVKQFKNVDDFNFDPESKLYYHCYDEKKVMQWANKENGRSPNVWLRSVGWLAMADADVIAILQDNGFPLLTKPLKKQLAQVLASMEQYMDKESKMWKDLPVIEDPGNYLEASGSLMLSYGYMKGARIGALSYDDIKKGTAIFEGVVNSCLKEGHLENICLVSGLDNERRDGSVPYYLSEPRVKDDAKGVGPFMMAYAEYLLLPY